MKRLSLLAIDCKFICCIKVRYFKALEAIVRFFVLWLENAEIILLTKKLDQGKISSQQWQKKICRLEGGLHNWEAEEYKNAFEFPFFFLKGGKIFNDYNSEGNKLMLGTAAEPLSVLVSVRKPLKPITNLIQKLLKQ